MSDQCFLGFNGREKRMKNSPWNVGCNISYVSRWCYDCSGSFKWWQTQTLHIVLIHFWFSVLKFPKAKCWHQIVKPFTKRIAWCYIGNDSYGWKIQNGKYRGWENLKYQCSCENSRPSESIIWFCIYHCWNWWAVDHLKISLNLVWRFFMVEQYKGLRMCTKSYHCNASKGLREMNVGWRS